LRGEPGARILGVRQDPALAPTGNGFLLRGVLYWLKLSSLTFVARMYDLDLTSVAGPTAGPAFGALAQLLATAAGATLIVTLWLQWRFFRHAWRTAVWQQCVQFRPRSWLRV
jgi:hypothetical protein